MKLKVKIQKEERERELSVQSVQTALQIILEEEMCMLLPEDSVMLLSFLNLKLRDNYSSLEELCEDMEVEQSRIEEKLSSIGYHYDKERNQFI